MKRSNIPAPGVCVSKHFQPVSSDTILVRVPYIFEARVLQRRRRKETCKVYRDVATLQLERIPSAEVAYTIKLGKAESVHILFHKGRLLWPMKYRTPFIEPVDGDALQALEDGSLDLFGSGDPMVEIPSLDTDLAWRKIIANGQDEALALLWRRSHSCVVVGSELYAEGGVPIFLAKTSAFDIGGVFVASSGADRRVDVRTGGLLVQPGGFHLSTVQRSISRGTFQVPSGIEHIGCHPFWPPSIVTHRRIPIKEIDLRIDAAFRQSWAMVKHPWPRIRCNDVKFVCAKFELAIPTDVPDVSSVRCDALHAMLADNPTHAAFDYGKDMLRILDLAVISRRTISHAEYLQREMEILDAALERGF
jgi:hypothetical protein